MKPRKVLEMEDNSENTPSSITSKKMITKEEVRTPEQMVTVILNDIFETDKKNLEFIKIFARKENRDEFNKDFLDFLNEHTINYNDIDPKVLCPKFLKYIEIKNDKSKTNKYNSPYAQEVLYIFIQKLHHELSNQLEDKQNNDSDYKKLRTNIKEYCAEIQKNRSGKIDSEKSKKNKESEDKQVKLYNSFKNEVMNNFLKNDNNDNSISIIRSLWVKSLNEKHEGLLSFLLLQCNTDKIINTNKFIELFIKLVNEHELCSTTITEHMLVQHRSSDSSSIWEEKEKKNKNNFTNQLLKIQREKLEKLNLNEININSETIEIITTIIKNLFPIENCEIWREFLTNQMMEDKKIISRIQEKTAAAFCIKLIGDSPAQIFFTFVCEAMGTLKNDNNTLDNVECLFIEGIKKKNAIINIYNKIKIKNKNLEDKKIKRLIKEIFLNKENQEFKNLKIYSKKTIIELSIKAIRELEVEQLLKDKNDLLPKNEKQQDLEELDSPKDSPKGSSNDLSKSLDLTGINKKSNYRYGILFPSPEIKPQKSSSGRIPKKIPKNGKRLSEKFSKKIITPTKHKSDTRNNNNLEVSLNSEDDFLGKKNTPQSVSTEKLPKKDKNKNNDGMTKTLSENNIHKKTIKS